MPIKFLDVEKIGGRRSNSNTNLQKFNSAASTLNNTPNISRNPSPSPHKQGGIMNHLDKRIIMPASGYTNDELDLAYMGCVVITCFLTSGLIDAVAFNSWNCFVRMQTGMTGSTMV